MNTNIFKTKNQNIFQIIIYILIILILLYIFKYIYSNVDTFKNIPVGSISGYGYLNEKSDMPLLLNLYPEEMGTDFNLRSFINKSKYATDPYSVGKNNMQSNMQSNMKDNTQNILGVFTNNMGQVNISSVKSPIILISGIGIPKIFAKWDYSDSSISVKSLDAYGNFETNGKWSCKSFQNNWEKIWFPEDLEGLSLYCWENNINVTYDSSTNSLKNRDGLISSTNNIGVIDPSNKYMNDFISTLEANGYIKNVNLFMADYDFRLISDKSNLETYIKSLTNLIEMAYNRYNKDVIIIGHDLGATLGNIFLVKKEQEWKDKFINKFIMINASIGGSPKALRTILSGENLVNTSIGIAEQNLLRNSIKNFSGLHLSLPHPYIYNNKPLLIYQNILYYASDIPKLLELAFGSETANIYKLSLDIQTLSLQDPNVNVYSLNGTNLITESFYSYQYSLLDPPQQKYPFYDLYTNSNTNQFSYNNLSAGENGNGDGTIPLKSLMFPINNWKNIKYQFYNRGEHLKILSMYEPIKDIINIIQDKI